MTEFHTKTLRLLGTDPRISARAIRAIEEAEERLGIRLPLSVREWYGYRHAVRILATCSNNDPPIPVVKFALEQWNAETLLPFKYENQGVCEWAILLDGSDDPPVYVDVDESGWQVQASTFSDYVYSCVWDYNVVLGRPAVVQAQNDPITKGAISTLAVEFTEQLRTHGWPGATQYRFGGSRQAILIWAAGDQADWFVAAEDADGLRSVLETVWDLDHVGERFYDCSPLGKIVLEAMRKEA